MTGAKCMAVLDAMSWLNGLHLSRLLLEDPLRVNTIAHRLTGEP
jgi:hypothetical protein